MDDNKQEAHPEQSRSSSTQADVDLPDSSGGEEWEELSEVSDSPDVGDVHVPSGFSAAFTREDQILSRIDRLKDLLRPHPLVPRDPRGPSLPLLDMSSGVSLPDAHCAFQGCKWCEDVTRSSVVFLNHVQAESYSLEFHRLALFLDYHDLHLGLILELL